jgi:homoserine kinase
MPVSIAEIAVPGSTSNLGPAFDALSVAVALYLRAEVLELLPSQPGTLDVTFGGAAPKGENRIETAFRLAHKRAGVSPAGARVRVCSEIPMAAGLGSSAAATVAGLRLYELAAGIHLDTADLLSMATELDGHPDNASAALLGGITLSCQRDDGHIIARSWRWPDALRFVVVAPELKLATKKARAVLPAAVPLHDAVANLQRALLFVRALDTGHYEDIREALKDRWHQPARGALVPGLAEALAIDHPSVLGVCLSGAGPSVLAIAAPGRADEAAFVLGDVYQRLAIPHSTMTLAAHQGALPRLPLSPNEREITA